MDTSKEYIKMCDCPEIQDGHIPSLDDIYTGRAMFNEHHTYGEGSTWLFCQQGSFSTDPQNKDYIWLPRQGQLQEMANNNNIHDLLGTFASWHTSWGVMVEAYAWSFTSMEQLWLAFVMKERWNKTWNGTVWE